MAKKTVATLHEGSKDGRAYTKVIKMVKSPTRPLRTSSRTNPKLILILHKNERLQVKLQPLFWLYHGIYVTLPRKTGRRQFTLLFAQYIKN